MVNGLGVVGWGVGGIEAEAAMLGQPISMLIPPRPRLPPDRPTGRGRDSDGPRADRSPSGCASTASSASSWSSSARGSSTCTIADRATLGNMCPEYGATIAIFPIDDMTLDYLRLTGREEASVRLVEAYAKAQGLFRQPGDPDRRYYARRSSSTWRRVEPSLAGPRRPQDRVSLRQAKAAFEQALARTLVDRQAARRSAPRRRQPTGGVRSPPATVAPELDHGAVVIAAITSCTNTSNPSVMIGAGLLAKKAVERGLRVSRG